MSILWTARHLGKLPVLNLYSSHTKGKFVPDNHRVMVYDGQSVFRWHENRFIFPNEKTSSDDSRRVGYFVEHKGTWYLVNERLPQMRDVRANLDVPIGGKCRTTGPKSSFLRNREDDCLLSRCPECRGSEL